MSEPCRCGAELAPYTMGRITFDDDRHWCLSCRMSREYRTEKALIEKVAHVAHEAVAGVLYEHRRLETRTLADCLRDDDHLEHIRLHLAALEDGDAEEDHLRHLIARAALLLYQKRG